MNFCSLARIAVPAFMLSIAGCSSTTRFATKETGGSPPRVESSGNSAASLRKPNGKILLTLEGMVSYYAGDFHGKLTSNGETFDMHALTAAHRNFPFGTKVRVTNLDNNKSIIVRVNDRGPFVEGRLMDLSLAAAKEIDLIRLGTTKARLEVLEWGDGKPR
ncbi:MAG: septal ring lytic transglycosylase RlpA family protein [Ignavibacteriales bacterium]|nr:septal ring lytic transglycosylase RlpA family protein [Ignavibacteriales bacterium]